MGIFDRFRSKTDDTSSKVQGNTPEASAAINPSLDLTEAPAPPSFDSSLNIRPEDSSKLYNPYEGLGAVLDRRDVAARGGFRIPKEPEFLFSEEATVHHRSWSENLTYYTGVGYLTGALAGGGTGALKTISQPVAVAGVGSTQRLRVNQLLNTSGKLGRSAGNSLGVLGLMFASFESFYGYLNDGLVPKELATLGAGASTGAVFRSVRGPRQAAAAGAVGLIGASTLLTARKFISRGL